MYAAPIISGRNAHSAPVIVRVADVLWCAAGTSGLYQESTIAAPISVFFLLLTLVDRVGGWDYDVEAIFENLHMYIKCFIALYGNLTCQTVLSPVSQSNATGGGKGGIRGTALNIKARCKQAVRHDTSGVRWIPAFLCARESRFGRTASVPRDHFDHCVVKVMNESNLYISAIKITSTKDTPDGNCIFSDLIQGTSPEPHWETIFSLTHRLFEAWTGGPELGIA
ncbi:hypothetical protein EsDP_00000589 [Epichloe bromicola]|uniref:Uncharacterized protein n=1 Tax=Epichloe bromicola TaxID=79588 RepID=A0ABQ0CFC2_9HYPO